MEEESKEKMEGILFLNLNAEGKPQSWKQKYTVKINKQNDEKKMKKNNNNNKKQTTN